MPILQSSVRQRSSQYTPYRSCSAARNSRRKNTVLPPSGITPAAACSLSRDWNHLKYSSTLADRHQPLACARHQRRPRPNRPAGSGSPAGSVVAFISCTPHCTIPAPVVRNRWSTIRSSSGWNRSSASAIPTHSYGIVQVVQHLDRAVQPDRLVVDRVLLRVRADHHPLRVLPGGRVRDLRGRHVVLVVDDRHHPVARVVQVGQSPQRRPGHRDLVPHRHQDRAGQLAARPECRTGPGRCAPDATTCRAETAVWCSPRRSSRRRSRRGRRPVRRQPARPRPRPRWRERARSGAGRPAGAGRWRSPRSAAARAGTTSSGRSRS